MALFSLNVSYVSRKQGRSIAAAAAYRSGELLYDNYIGKNYDYTDRQDVLYKEIILPKNAPREYYNRELLVGAINNSETRSDSRTAREIKIALPNELSLEQNIKLVKNYVLENFVKIGMCADVAIHEGPLEEHKKPSSIKPVFGRQNNPHAHILLTTRKVDSNGFDKKKCREWDSKFYVSLWRKAWADIQNKEFEILGSDARVSHESYAAQGQKDREPTKHLGPAVMELELRGIETNRGDEYREILSRNKDRYIERQLKMERNMNYERSR